MTSPQTNCRESAALLDCLKELRRAGVDGARSLAAMRSSGNRALIILIEREISRILSEAAGTDPVTEAIGRAQEKAHEEEQE